METLEEATELFFRKKAAKNCTLYKAAKFGAKWQQERSYSEEDLREAFKDAYSLGFRDWLQINFKQEKCDEWFEQFKNK